MVLACNDKYPAHANDTRESGYEAQLRLFVIDVLNTSLVGCGWTESIKILGFEMEVIMDVKVCSVC